MAIVIGAGMRIGAGMAISSGAPLRSEGGGGGGGGGTTYSGGVDYNNPPTVGSGSGLIFLDSGPRLLLQSPNWSNSNYNTLMAQGSGTVYTLTLGNGQTGTFTTTGAWSIAYPGGTVYGTTTLTGVTSVMSITFTP